MRRAEASLLCNNELEACERGGGEGEGEGEGGGVV